MRDIGLRADVVYLDKSKKAQEGTAKKRKAKLAIELSHFDDPPTGTQQASWVFLRDM